MNDSNREIHINREFKEGHHHQKMADCVCFCGKSFTTTLSKVKNGHTRSCGCLRAITSRKLLTKHEKHATREYRAWAAMKNRCLNPKSDRYPSYGGRGITIVEDWLSFEKFYRDMGECPAGLTLDRIDVNAGYGPYNCRWATVEEQANNKTNTLFVECDGQKMSLSQAARIVGLDYKGLRYRIKVKQMSFDSAVKDIVK